MSNILMTGAGRGFGLYIADRLKAQGHDLFTVGEEETHDLQMDILYENPHTIGETIFNQAEEKMGGMVDILINNAGVTHINWTENHDVNAFNDMMTINVSFPFVLVQEFIRRIKSLHECFGSPGPATDVRTATFDGKYRIINTCSMSTKMGLRACCGYPASKAALETMTRCWAKEFANRWPVVVLGISPGNIEDSHMVEYAVQRLQETRDMTREEAEKYNAQSPLGRYGTYDEVWKVFDFAVNEAPEYMTGSIITMPNGMGIR